MSFEQAAPALLAAQRERSLLLHQELNAEYQRVMAASQDSNADDEHDPEGATIAYERSQLATMIGAVRRQLDDIELAIVRAAQGTWAVCERCGQQIPAERLAARPATRRCVNCAGRP